MKASTGSTFSPCNKPPTTNINKLAANSYKSNPKGEFVFDASHKSSGHVLDELYHAIQNMYHFYVKYDIVTITQDPYSRVVVSFRQMKYLLKQFYIVFPPDKQTSTSFYCQLLYDFFSFFIFPQMLNKYITTIS
jgi:hypothetical protein